MLQLACRAASPALPCSSGQAEGRSHLPRKMLKTERFPHHRPQRLSAMAHREFLLLARLAERAPHLRTEKQGIVPEAALAPRLVENGSFHRPPPHATQLPAFRQRDGAHE